VKTNNAQMRSLAVSHKLRRYELVVIAVAVVFTMCQTAQAALMLNYQFEEVEGAAPDQTTPDSSGTFASVVGSVNALQGHGTNTPGIDYPNQLAGPVVNTSAQVKSLNPNFYMNFPGNPASGGISGNVERVNIADATVGTGGATLDKTFSKITISFWVNPSSLNRDRAIIGKMGSATPQRGWFIFSPAGTDDLYLDYWADGSSGERELRINDVLPLDTWTHVVFTFDGSGTTNTDAVYVNNVLEAYDVVVGSVPDTFNGDNNAPFRVGHRGSTQTNAAAWAGGIDDVRIFDDEALAYSPIGSATGTGSLLAPEPSVFAALSIAGLVLNVAVRHRKT
jgi:hypothetical protein